MHSVFRSTPLARLLLVLAITAVTFQTGSVSFAAGGFGGNNCPQMCENLCNGQRYQCYDFCDIRFTDPAQLSDCYWDCSLQMGRCREQCLMACN